MSKVCGILFYWRVNPVKKAGQKTRRMHARGLAGYELSRGHHPAIKNSLYVADQAGNISGQARSVSFPKLPLQEISAWLHGTFTTLSGFLGSKCKHLFQGLFIVLKYINQLTDSVSYCIPSNCEILLQSSTDEKTRDSLITHWLIFLRIPCCMGREGGRKKWLQARSMASSQTWRLSKVWESGQEGVPTQKGASQPTRPEVGNFACFPGT